MDLATTLKSQTVQNRVRAVGINANYWHAVGWASQLKPSEVMPVMIWQPIGPSESRSSALFFKVRLPGWALRSLKPLLWTLIQRFVLYKFFAQDIEMIESEQQTYLANPQQRYVEINPAIVTLQRVIVRQYQQFMQKSSQSPTTRDRDSESISFSKEMALPKAPQVPKSQVDLTKENSIG